MTKDEALTMIIASIAMEELALSHIVNAEGEKLQYILGTLPGRQGICVSSQEILAVNKSVKELLDTVMQSQLLLKGKMEKALEASGHAPVPEPPCPCDPPPCSPHACEPPCSCPCCQKSAIQLVSRCDGITWENGFLMSWRCQKQVGSSIRWNENTPSLVSLDPQKTYALHYAINIHGPYVGGSAGTISVKLTPSNAFLGALPFYFSLKCPECVPLTLHYSTTLFPHTCQASSVSLSLLLNYRNSLFVDQASLNIVEI